MENSMYSFYKQWIWLYGEMTLDLFEFCAKDGLLWTDTYRNYGLLTTRIYTCNIIFRWNSLDSFEYETLERTCSFKALCGDENAWYDGVYFEATKSIVGFYCNRRLHSGRQRCIFVCRFPCGRSTASHPTVLVVPRTLCAGSVEV